MQRIGYVKETTGDVEAALLRLTKEEEDELKNGAKEFVNKRQIFGKGVESFELHTASAPETVFAAQTSVTAETSAATCMLLVLHRLSCRCTGTCIPLNEKLA